MYWTKADEGRNKLEKLALSRSFLQVTYGSLDTIRVGQSRVARRKLAGGRRACRPFFTL